MSLRLGLPIAATILVADLPEAGAGRRSPIGFVH